MHFAHPKNRTNLPVSKLKFVCTAQNNIDSVFLLTSSLSNTSPFSFPLPYPSYGLLHVGEPAYTHKAHACAHADMHILSHSCVPQITKDWWIQSFWTEKGLELNFFISEVDKSRFRWDSPFLHWVPRSSVPCIDCYVMVCRRRGLAARSREISAREVHALCQ